ncbi:hypothetical protein AB0O01_33770 [Streptomyces sp. NPDC093252]|uniref:hypothetical protein n=1 Tax=Streptomyces sp. NPDC093252 TaxID=3154980 RepID=UPI00343B661D
MGVFARFLRRSKSTEEAATEEVSSGAGNPAGDATPGTETDTVTAAEAGTEAVSDTVTGAGAGSGAESGTGAAVQTDGSDAAATAGERTARDTEVPATASVEIPHQQSAAEAADNEAGEGART